MTEISAMIAVRDGEQYLMEAIESILAQSRPVAEVIVVDDGSTDGSAAIAESVGAPVVCVRCPARGMGPALNTGVERARGELIAFLDADDLWTPNRVELQASALEADPELQLVFGATEQFLSPELNDAQRARIGNAPGVGRGRLRSAMMARASVFEVVGRFDDRWTLGVDIDWMARADELGVRSRMLEDVVLRRRLHDSNMTSNRAGHADYARIVAAARARRAGR